MVFDEIDKAQAEAAKTNFSGKRGKKRKNATIARLNPTITGNASIVSAEDGATGGGVGQISSPSHESALRTGRWTPQETAYCDKLIQLFERGLLPIPDEEWAPN